MSHIEDHHHRVRVTGKLMMIHCGEWGGVGEHRAECEAALPQLSNWILLGSPVARECSVLALYTRQGSHAANELCPIPHSPSESTLAQGITDSKLPQAHLKVCTGFFPRSFLSLVAQKSAVYAASGWVWMELG